MPPAPRSLQEVADWLTPRSNLLVVAHLRPDGDAFGSVFAAVRMLQASGRSAKCHFSQPIPHRFHDFLPEGVLVGCEVDPDEFDGLLCLDCANVERLDLPPGWDLDDCPLPVCNVDHHVSNQQYGQVNFVDDTYAATAQIIADLAKEANFPQDTAFATAALIGIVSDSGGFRFTNTDARLLRGAAALLDLGADHAAVMDRLYFTESPTKIRLQARMLDRLQTACSGRFAFAVLTEADFAASGMIDRDTEGLIDHIRAIAGVDIACLIQPIGDNVHMSLRARSASTPVIGIADALGGGGHVVAAGVTMRDTSLETALEALHTHVSKVLSP